MVTCPKTHSNQKCKMCFSKVDMATAFLQISLHDKEFNTTTPDGLYEYNFLLLGTSASPAIFKKNVWQILVGINNIMYVSFIKFIKNFSDVFSPLHRLLRENVKFILVGMF